MCPLRWESLGDDQRAHRPARLERAQDIGGLCEELADRKVLARARLELRLTFDQQTLVAVGIRGGYGHLRASAAHAYGTGGDVPAILALELGDGPGGTHAGQA